MFGRTKRLENEIVYLKDRISNLERSLYEKKLRMDRLMDHLGVREITTRAETKIVKIEKEKSK